MSSDKPLVDLVMVACDMRATNAGIYQRLCEALRSLEVQAIGEMVSRDEPHDLFRTQGRVKTIQQIRRHVTECQQMRDTFERRANAQRPNPGS